MTRTVKDLTPGTLYCVLGSPCYVLVRCEPTVTGRVRLTWLKLDVGEVSRSIRGDNDALEGWSGTFVLPGEELKL